MRDGGACMFHHLRDLPAKLWHGQAILPNVVSHREARASTARNHLVSRCSPAMRMWQETSYIDRDCCCGQVSFLTCLEDVDLNSVADTGFKLITMMEQLYPAEILHITVAVRLPCD